MKTALLAAALIAFGTPAFASAEAPVHGGAATVTAPAFTTAGSEGSAMFRPATPQMTLTTASQRLGSSAEAYIGPRG
ncbi:hypothetical protein [Elioraea sp.]|uniref:hypothetical protein n=1 Tax=Elioraea sp. TaxID=2185103 RepID=UPI0025BBD1CF|nr:hypothetical protein [Elioraea sp.]